MREQDFRDGLRVAVADEPALVFDPDALITRARRESARRRTLVAAGVATMSVAAAAVAVPLVLNAPQRGGPVGPGSTGTPTAQPCAAQPCPPSGPEPTVPEPGAPQPGGSTPTIPPEADIAWPPPGVTPVRYTRERMRVLAAEQQNYVRTRFGEVVPEATGIRLNAFTGEMAGTGGEGQANLEGMTWFTIGGVRSVVAVHLSAPGDEHGLHPRIECGGDPRLDRCTGRRLEDGSLLVTSTHETDVGGKLLAAAHFRNNGSAVRVTGYNYDPTGRYDPAGENTEYQPEVAVSIEQLIELATDPKLGI